jgi:rubrerythrin
MDDDDPVNAAGREIAAAARAVATGVAVAARAKSERQAERRFEEARRVEARHRASGAWNGVERRGRPHEAVAG